MKWGTLLCLKAVCPFSLGEKSRQTHEQQIEEDLGRKTAEQQWIAERKKT
jgi:hypothetical protein